MVPLAATAVPFTDAKLLATAVAVAVTVALLARMVVTAGLVWVTGGSDAGSANARQSQDAQKSRTNSPVMVVALGLPTCFWMTLEMAALPDRRVSKGGRQQRFP